MKRDKQFHFWNNRFLITAYLTLGFVILLARKWEFVKSPTLFAEDGLVFLSQYFAHGPRSILIPYAEYLHFLPRLGALFGGLMPVSYIAAAYCGFSVATAFFAYALIFNRNIELKNPAVLFAMMIFVPHNGEIFFTLTNTIWFAGFILFLMLFLREPVSLKYKLIIYFSSIILSLTGIYSVLLAPIYGLNLLFEKTRFRLTQFAIVTLGGAIQATIFLQLKPLGRTPFVFDIGWPDVFSYRIFYQSFFGKNGLGLTLKPFICNPYFFFIAICGAFVFAWRSRNRVALFSTLFFIALLLATTFRFPGSYILNNPGDGDRYFALPLFLTSIVLCELMAFSDSRLKKIIVGSFIVAFIISGVKKFTMEKYEKRNWAVDSACFGGNSICSVPIVPFGMGFTYFPDWPYIMPWQRFDRPK